MTTRASAPDPGELLAEAAWLRRLARSLVDEATADDVVQETYAAALASPPRGDQPLRPWLAVVLRNFVRMGRRGQARRQQREQTAGDVSAGVLPTPEELLAQHQARRLVADAVESLDEPYRSTVLLCYGQGLGPSEVARQQGILPGTVRWRLSHALDLLRARLDQQQRGGESDRRAWVVALAPLTSGGAHKTSPGAGALFAPIVWLAKAKLVVGVIIVLILAASALWLLRRPSPAGGGPVADLAVQDREERRGAVAARAAKAEAPGVVPLVAAGASAPADPGADGDAAAGGRIAGTIRDQSGRPIAGAWVSVMPPTDLSQVAAGRPLRIAGAATSASDGRYEISGLRLQPHTVTATAAGFDPGHREGVSPQRDTRAGTDVDLTLIEGGATLRGTVRDVGGGPIAGARVMAANTGRDLSRVIQAITGTEGGYVLNLQARGRYVFVAEASGYAQQRLPAESTVGDRIRDIVLHPAARITGRVLSADGTGVAGATVRLARSEGNIPFVYKAVSGEGGGFEFAEVSPGSYGLWARKDEQAARAHAPVTATAAETVRDLRVTLAPGRSITGQVRRADGAPVAGAELWFAREEGAPSQERQAVTGPDGRYRIEGALPGTYGLTAGQRGLRTGNREITVAERDLTGVDFELVPEARVSGLVLGIDGAPAPMVRIAAEVKARDGARQGYTTRTIADGTFTLAGAPAGDLRVLAEDEHLGLAATGGTLAAGEQRRVTLRLTPGLKLSGRVTEAGGRPVPGAHVTAMQGPQALRVRRTVRTAADGRFVVPALDAGEVRLLATEKEPPVQLRDLPPVRQVVTVTLDQTGARTPIELTIAR